MKGSVDAKNEFVESNKQFIEKAGSSSKTADGVALCRFNESQSPEGERICYDPYAVYFLALRQWSLGLTTRIK